MFSKSGCGSNLLAVSLVMGTHLGVEQEYNNTMSMGSSNNMGLLSSSIMTCI